MAEARTVTQLRKHHLRVRSFIRARARHSVDPERPPNAARHPGLRIIFDHMGIMARCVDDAIEHWVSETADVHVYPNIYVKVSAISGYSAQPFPNPNIEKYVHEMVDKMGPQRCYWGSDITRLLGHGLTYTDTIERPIHS